MTTPTNALIALAERVEKGSGEDWPPAHDFALALGWQRESVTGIGWMWTPPNGRRHVELPLWLTSIDAVVALIEERLPDCFWDLDKSGDCRLWISGPATQFNDQVASEPRTGERARGLLAAFLKALAAQEPANEG